MTEIPANLYRTAENIVIRNRRLFVTLVHLVQVALANYLAFAIRFESAIPPLYVEKMFAYVPILLAVRLAFYLQAGLYKQIWRYASISDLVGILKSATFGSIAFLVVVRYLFGDTAYPRSIYILDWLLLIIISGGSRLFLRVLKEHLQSGRPGKRILLIGAGNAGEMILRDMKTNPSYNYEPIGFIDDDPHKKGLSIHGVPIFGPKSMLGEVVAKYKPDEILICIPSAGYRTINELFELCTPFNIPIKTLPGLSDILYGNVSVSQIKPLSLTDLLRREPVSTDISHVKDYIQGKAVMITGAGGSIGSELARQVSEYGPSDLILFDRYENGLFHIDLELMRDKKPASISTVVGDILDTTRLEYIFSRHTPQIVFHAAAHKHVPLMEANPLEAVKNNIIGTKNLMETAVRHKTESFVMISTDKAVNPTSIMGATKRVAELLTLNMNSSSDTTFSVVRFGNVLGSTGSVVHTFKEQLERGGPLTVTHPEMKRFFMLIPEAVQLVLMAASSGKGGELFVLDMGEPIKIVDFAENIIRLSGLIPHEDITIEFTGLRPGEKLYEELFDESEEVVPTPIKSVRIAIPKCPSPEELSQHVAELEMVVRDQNLDQLVPIIQKMVPTFKK